MPRTYKSGFSATKRTGSVRRRTLGFKARTTVGRFTKTKFTAKSTRRVFV